MYSARSFIRCSRLVRFVQEGMREQGLGIAPKWLHKDPFGNLAGTAVTAADALIAPGIAHIPPVGRPVDGANKARRINKGFQEQ